MNFVNYFWMEILIFMLPVNFDSVGILIVYNSEAES